MIQLGKKYVWGMKGPDEFDEAGLSFYIFKELFQIDIEKDGYGMNEITNQFTSSVGTVKKYIEDDSDKEKYLNDIQSGDLIFFHTKSLDDYQPSTNNQYPGHVGIYLGDKKFIHITVDTGVVVIDELKDGWLDKLVASRDIIANII